MTTQPIPAHCPWLHASHGEVPRTIERCYTCQEPFDHRWSWKAYGLKFVLAVSPDGRTRAVVYQCGNCFQRKTHPSLRGADETENADTAEARE